MERDDYMEDFIRDQYRYSRMSDSDFIRRDKNNSSNYYYDKGSDNYSNYKEKHDDNVSSDKDKCSESNTNCKGNCNENSPNCRDKCRCNSKHDKEDHSDGMCNGVFAPICEPEVCDIPRPPRRQDLVVGNGTIGENQITEVEMCHDKNYRFTIHIFREFTDHFGRFTLFNDQGAPLMKSDRLECYHAPTEDNMVAIFHVTLDDGTSREVTVYGKTNICDSPAALYVYSAPLYHEEINVGSDLLQGELKIYMDQMSHDH